MSLVPIDYLGNHYGVSVHGMENIIRRTCIAHQTDYWRRGRTMERLGIKHLSVSELTRYVTGISKHHMSTHTRCPKLTPISIAHVEQSRKFNGGSMSEQGSLPMMGAVLPEISTKN
jgi:hypothetical protein